MTVNQQAYYQSHRKLNFIGTGGQVKLSAAKVLVIGAGGLGCPCLQYLAGCGIGTLGIADFDTVAISNLHRQILYSAGNVGQPKALVAAAVLKKYNPYIVINQYNILVDESNILPLLGGYDIIVDCTDNFAVRYLINDACVYLNKPLVYGAIHQTEGQVAVFNYNGSATLRCLFTEPDADTHIPSCAEVGAYNIITAMIGVMMANETLKVILQHPDVLVNKIASYDAVPVSMRTIKYKPLTQSRATSMARFSTNAAPIAITAQQFNALPPGGYQLIDVREDWERNEHHIGGHHIPLNALGRYDFSAWPKSNQVIIYCELGTRSNIAANLLRKMGYNNTFSLQGGLKALR